MPPLPLGPEEGPPLASAPRWTPIACKRGAGGGGGSVMMILARISDAALAAAPPRLSSPGAPRVQPASQPASHVPSPRRAPDSEPVQEAAAGLAPVPIPSSLLASGAAAANQGEGPEGKTSQHCRQPGSRGLGRGKSWQATDGGFALGCSQ